MTDVSSTRSKHPDKQNRADRKVVLYEKSKKEKEKLRKMYEDKKKSGLIPQKQNQGYNNNRGRSNTPGSSNFLPTVDQSYEFEDYKRWRKRAAYRKKKQQCFPEGQPIFITSLKSDDEKMTALGDLDKKTEDNKWKDILPNMDIIQLHALYKIETKAHRIHYPFKFWLQRAALKMFYQEKRMEYFCECEWSANEENIFHQPTIAPIFTSKLENIEKAFRHVMSMVQTCN
jgi:hypothetical protein